MNVLANILDPYWAARRSVRVALGALVVGSCVAGTLVYVYLFKAVSFMQSRLGPDGSRPARFDAADGRGRQVPAKRRHLPDQAPTACCSRLAPYVVFMSTFLLVLVIPFGPDAWFADLDVGIYFALAVSSISVIGILMAGWSSANKYSLLGGLRAAGQLIAYELPLVLAVVGVVIQAGTLNMQGIVSAQANGEIFGFGGIGNPYILTQFVGFVIFMISMQAELTQTPFDMPIAESELVTGYLTEYTGMRFLLFFIAEFATAGVFSAIAAVLFLGGWSLPGHVVGQPSATSQHHERRRAAGADRQGHDPVVHHLLGALHLPPLS